MWPEFDGQTIVNVRWSDCEIRAHFKETVFLNCDFRGSRFVDCSFEGATFVNCLLDGASLIDSRVVGPVSSFREEYPEGVPPSFEIAVDPGQVEAIRKYRGIRAQVAASRSPAASLISHTSGMPAVPMDEQHDAVFPETLTNGQPWRIRLPREIGGLAMYGGRLCSLRLHRTTFIDGGMFAVRLVSGSALDLVEHAGGELNVDIYGSAIRGLTITGSSAGRSGDPVRLKVAGVDAVLANTWLGDGLEGTVEFTSAVLWHMMSLSNQGPEQLTVRFDDCAYFGLVNVGDLDSSTPIEEFLSSGIEKRLETIPVGERMDYESDPARSEYERRSRATPESVWPTLAGPFENTD